MFGLHGAGLSTTLGLVYIKEINRGSFDCNMSNDRQRKYKYRIGLSLIDLGMIRYFDETTVSNVKTETDVFFNNPDSLETVTIKRMDQTIVRNLNGTAEDESFNMWLPLAISLQFDYQVIPNVFANVSTINRIHFTPNQIARANQVNLSARYERRFFEAALSYSITEYETSALGLGLRYRFIVIGSDRLLSTLGLSDDNNYDVFFDL
jgi:hypothetical protein